MFKSYKISDGRVVECPEDAIGPIQLYSNPTDEDRKFLVEECGIDEHTYYSALDEDEISRVEYESNHIAVIFKQQFGLSFARYERNFRLNGAAVAIRRGATLKEAADEWGFCDKSHLARLLNNLNKKASDS